MEIMDASIVGLITSAICIFLLWKFLSTTVFPFELAVRVFLDEKRLDKYDTEHSTIYEERWNVIGRVEDILFVVYVEVNSRIRIISARKADKEETDEYYRNYDLR